jgi:hypothetical protein
MNTITAPFEHARGMPTAPRRRALLGTVLTTFPRRSPRCSGAPGTRRRPEPAVGPAAGRAPGPIAGRALEDAPSAPTAEPRLEVQIEADLRATDVDTDERRRGRARSRSIPAAGSAC